MKRFGLFGLLSSGLLFSYAISYAAMSGVAKADTSFVFSWLTATLGFAGLSNWVNFAQSEVSI